MVRFINICTLDNYKFKSASERMDLSVDYMSGWNDAIDHIAIQTPTVDAVPVVHGRWIRDEFGTKCGVCGLYAYRDKFDQPWESPYCPNCGSRNRSEE